MASDPMIREHLLANLMRCGGSVYGLTFGEVVRQLRPDGCSMNQSKIALNSLAYSRRRQRQIAIRRTGTTGGLDNCFGGYHITSV